jgi:hypothetical protein
MITAVTFPNLTQMHCLPCYFRTLKDTRITKLRKLWQDNYERYIERDVGGSGCGLWRKWYEQGEDPQVKAVGFRLVFAAGTSRSRIPRVTALLQVTSSVTSYPTRWFKRYRFLFVFWRRRARISAGTPAILSFVVFLSFPDQFLKLVEGRFLPNHFRFIIH